MNEEPIDIRFDDPIGDISAEIDALLGDMGGKTEQGDEGGFGLVVADPAEGDGACAGGGMPDEGGEGAGEGDQEEQEAGAGATERELDGSESPGAGEEVEGEMAGSGEERNEEETPVEPEPDLPPPDSDRLTKMLNMRVTPSALAELKVYADTVGCSVSALVRLALFKHTGIDPQGNRPFGNGD